MAQPRKVVDLASDDTDAPMSRPPGSDSARGFASASSSAARPSSPATRELMEHIDALQSLLSSGPKSSTLANCAAPLGELAAQLRQLQERRASPHSSSSRASDLQPSQPHRSSMDWDQHDEEQKESAASSSAAAAAASSPAAAAAAASYPAAYSTPYDSSSSQVFLSASGTLMSDDELVARMIAEEEEQERVRRKQRQEQEEREFQQLLLREATCAACGTQPDGASELVQICDEARQRGSGPSCAHKVCHGCLQRYLKDVQAALAAPSAELLTEAELHCPAPGCQSQLQQWQIRAVLPPAEFEQLLTQCFQNALKRKSAGAGGAGAAKIVHCPNPQCSNVFEAVEGSGNAAAGAAGAATDVGVDGQVMSPASKLHRAKHRFRCNACSTVFCGECSAAPYHDGFDCAAFAQYKDAKKCRFCSISLTAANRAKPASVHAAAAAAAAAHGHQHLKAHHAIGAAAAAVGSAVNNFLRAAAGGVVAPAAAAAAAVPAAAVRPPSAYSQSAASFAPNSMLADVCNSPECIEKRGLSCESKLPCGHACGGVSGEKQHLLCLKEECPAHPADVDNEEEYCSVCYVEGLGQAPTIRLGCGHMFHFKCISDKLAKGWPGARITFGFLNCPLCKQVMQHPSLAALMDPLLRLKSDVQAKATARLKPEGLENDAAFTSPQGKYYGRRDEYALDRFAFYMCAKCDRPYFGGRRQCEEVAMQQAEQFNKEQLMCGGCTAGPDVKSCNVHGKDFIEHKCKFCCNIATWYCWGSTHFCDSCHKRQEQGDYLTKKALSDLPQCPGPGKCPVGTKHPQNGTAEFPMGCGVCRPRDNAV